MLHAVVRSMYWNILIVISNLLQSLSGGGCLFENSINSSCDGGGCHFRNPIGSIKLRHWSNAIF